MLVRPVDLLRTGSANKAPMTFFKMLSLSRTTQLLWGSLDRIKIIKPFSDKVYRGGPTAV